MGNMKVEIYPKDASKGRSFGFIVYTSSKVTVGSLAPYITFLPGIGGKGDGSEPKLNMLNNYEVPSQLKEGIERYGFICIAIQSDSAYTLGEAKFALDWAKANLPIDTTRKYLTGLSWGGGGTAYFIRQSIENAKMYDAAAPIAMTWQTGGEKNIVAANLPVWAFHNLKDNNGGTPVAATNAFVDAINKENPKVKATKTLFMTGPVHGGWGEAYSPTTIPIGPGSEGLINPACNLYEWFLMNTSTNRVVPPSKSVVTPTDPIPDTSVKAVVSWSVTGNKAALTGSKSTGWKLGYEGTWAFKSGPTGVKVSDVFPKGSSFINSEAILPKDGTYEFEFTLKIGTETKTETIKIVYGKITEPEPVKPKVVNFIWPDQLVFDNGDKITVKPTFTATDGTVY